MENKSFESLNSPLFLLSTEALLQIQGGADTRTKMWCNHGDQQDMDGYYIDWDEQTV